MKKQSIWVLTLFLVSAPALVFGIVDWCRESFEKLPLLGGYDRDEKGIPVRHVISGFDFENQDGQTLSSRNLGNKVLVANFFFTSCAGICPIMMRQEKEVQQYYNHDSDVLFISFTVDPVRDNVARLKWYANQYGLNGRNWELVTGDKKEIYKMARKSFYLSANEGDGGDNDFIHSEQIVLVDKTRHIRGYYDGTDRSAIKKLKLDIKKLEYEK